MKHKGIIFKLGDQCLIIAKDDSKPSSSNHAKANSAEVAKSAINGIYLDSQKDISEYYMYENAKRIYNIATKSSDPAVRVYAIETLGKISNRMYSSYYINCISSLKEKLV